MRLLKLALLLCVLALAGCGTQSTKTNRLNEMQYAYSAAIRWGDFEGAINLIDPKVRKELAEKLTPVRMERYKQIQVSYYRDIGSEADNEKGIAVRIIEIGVINRHTLAERSIRYRETWEWNEESKTWWLIAGLPDFWDGQ